MTAECACLLQVRFKNPLCESGVCLVIYTREKKKNTHKNVDNRPTDFPFRLWLLSHRKIQK